MEITLTITTPAQVWASSEFDSLLNEAVTRVMAGLTEGLIGPEKESTYRFEWK